MTDDLAEEAPLSWKGLGQLPIISNMTEIGSGAFGKVHKWNHAGTWMSVKVIRVVDGCAADIERETTYISQLSHKHIIRCYDIQRDAHYVYIIMDYAEGGNLKSAAPTLDWENKQRIVREVALGLAYLHGQGITHRDIKGENILLTTHGQAKLCDFGLANVMASATRASKYTPAKDPTGHGRPVGTKYWMAPELMTASPKYSSKTDIYALGVVMGELMEDADAPPDEYIALWKRCMEKDPEKRPTLDEIVATFRDIPDLDDSLDNGQRIETLITQAHNDYKEGQKLYRGGEGTEVNLAEAAERFRRAAKLGLKQAQYDLGMMYQRADQGYAPAQTSLGMAFRDGQGVQQDTDKALKLLEAATKQGYVCAYCNLAEMYGHGHGVEQNFTKAIELYRKAAELECTAAQVLLGVFYATGTGVRQDYMETAKFVRRAAEKGHPEAMCKLGFMYSNGQGVPEDHKKAREWWHKAAEADNREAQCHVGLLYINGEGVPKDKQKGLAWLTRAKQQGDEYARYLHDVSKMAKFNTAIVLLVLVTFLSAVMAKSCYCVNCGGQRCVRVDSATEAVFSDGLGTWYESYEGGYHIRGIADGDQAMFRTLCTRHQAMGGICY
ncbi:p21 protein (Cdc42 Rac)-activated kinase [Mortierella alpina]|nr:p21 protein (Cdc42 Rac)-activated kinase [Mortierella alpina]